MHILTRVRQSQFLHHNAVFFFGSVAVGALNYVYYPVLGRMLAPAAFGEVQTLVSLFLQFGIFLSVLSLVTVNIVANADNDEQRNALVLEFEKLALVVSAVLLLVTLIFQSQLQAFLQFESSWPFVLLALALVMTVPFTLRGAFLRGKQRFGLASTANLAGAGAKLGASALLVAAGLGTAGAIGGIVLAQSLACALVVWWSLRLGLRSDTAVRRRRLPDIRLLLPELKYALLVLVASLVVTVQYSIDIVVIKHYFDSHTAGLYAGIASAARIIFFLTASVALVLMPAVRLRNSAAQNRSLLLKSILLFGVLALPALLLFMAFPRFIIGTLMGTSYESMAGLLPRLSLAIFVVSIINLLVAYYLALRRYAIAAVTTLGALITYTLMVANHTSVAAVVNGLLIGSTVMLGLLLLWAGGARLHASRVLGNKELEGGLR
jgi:O-antigen/teichoic acid export membrane protein